MALPANKTKIVCTVGPASDSVPVLESMIRAGMNVARLNFSHGDFDSHREVIHKVRSAARAADRRVAIMADLPGPKIRIGDFGREPVALNPEDAFTLTTEDILGDESRVSVNFERLPEVVRAGDRIYLNDGMVQLAVTEVTGKEVACRVLVGGELTSRKGVNLPHIDLGVEAFTERDHECLTFAMEQGVDAVSQSFVENGRDMVRVREAANRLDRDPFLIAKIERASALNHLSEILSAADGIMIARGDLGVEIPIERIAVVQKELMLRSNQLGKPVITATQMLESMTENRRPTRAEATDVANAVLDGADCVMLSGESAVGKYPVDAVQMLARIAAAIEPRRPGRRLREDLESWGRDENVSLTDLISLSVELTLRRVSPATVMVPTFSGETARKIARFRLPVWVTAVSPQERTCQELLFSYGVYPVLAKSHPRDWNRFAADWVGEQELEGDLVVLTEGPSPEHPEANHRMELVAVGSRRRAASTDA